MQISLDRLLFLRESNNMLIEEIKMLPSTPIGSRIKVPSESGVYFVFKGDDLVYIGSSRNLQNRIPQHGSKWPDAIVRFMVVPEGSALKLEAALVAEHLPPENVALMPPPPSDFTCLRCGYQWCKRSKTQTLVPRQCPYCKSPKWSVEAKQTVKRS